MGLDLSATAVNMTGVVPVAAIAGLNSAAYPKYMSFLLRATLAAFSMPYCSLASDMLAGLGRTLAALIVAIRCGVWAATGISPDANVVAQPIRSCVYYRPEKDSIYREKGTARKDYAGWYWLLQRVEAPSKAMEELMLRIAHIAPVMLDMACAERSHTTGSYALPYVQRAVSTYLRSKLSSEAYAMANLHLPLVWSTMREASLHGLPETAIRAWATDEVFHIQAHRRLLTSTRELEESRRREAAALVHTVHIGLPPDEVPDTDADDELAAALRSSARPAPGADLESVVSMSDVDPEEFQSAGPSTPLEAGAATVVPSRTGTPPPQITDAERNAILESMHAQPLQQAHAASEMADVSSHIPAQW